MARRLWSAALLVWAVLLGLIPCGSFAQAPGPDLTAKLKAHAVLIRIDTGEDIGSGVILAVDRVVTNCHVAEEAVGQDTTIQVVTEADASPLPASLVARDPGHDLCLLAIDGSTLLPNAAIASIAATPVQEGDPVYTAGAPRGYIDSVTAGIVSARRNLPQFPVDFREQMATHFALCSKAELEAAWYIQSDAQFTYGSSGGGLFNAAGELVGITTFGESVDQLVAIRFAIPAAHVQALLDENPDRALLDVVKHFTEKGKLERAIATSERIVSSSDRVRALVNIAKVKFAAGQRSSAVAMLMTAAATARTIEHNKHRAARLGMVAEDLAEAEEFGLANRIAASIDVSERQSRTHRKVAKKQAKRGLFADAHRTVRQIKDVTIRAETNDDVFLEEIRVLIAEGNLPLARATANRIERISKRVSALRRIAGAYGKLGDVPASHRTYKEAISLANQLRDFAERARKLIEIAESMTDEEYPTDPRTIVDAAIRAAEQICEDEMRDKTFFDIVDELHDMTGFLETQFLLAGRIGDSGIRDGAIKVIVLTLSERGQFDGANQWAETINDLSSQGKAQTGIVQDLIDQEDWESATTLASGVAHDPSRAEALYEIAVAQAASENILAASRIADLIDDPVRQAAAYLFITDEVVYTDRVNRELANDLLETTKALIESIGDPDERARQLIDLAVVYVAAGKGTQAKQIESALVTTRHYASVLRHLSEAYVDFGDIDEAEELIKRIPHCAKREYERAMDHLDKRR